MKKMVLFLIFYGGLMSPTIAQNSDVNKKLRNLFFDLPFCVGIQTIKEELGKNSNFVFYDDPNRDREKSVVGSLVKDKSLDSNSVRNRVVILVNPSKKKSATALLRWSLDYKLKDLAAAILEYERLKSEFMPYFVDFVETKKIGYSQEEIQTMVLKKNKMSVVIRIMMYNNFIHTVSIEFSDTWKVTEIRKPN